MRIAMLAVFVVAVATARASTEPLTAPPPLDPTPLAAAATPDLLWPLTRPPGQGPHLDLLAWYPAWPDTCSQASGPNVPADVVAYVAAWCGPADRRIDALDRLVRSGLAEDTRAATRSDLVALVAVASDHADAWLTARNLGTRDMLEALAATELALGKVPRWFELKVFPADQRCHVIGLNARSGNNEALWRAELASIAEVPNALDGDACSRMLDALECRLVARPSGSAWTSEAELTASLAAEMAGCGSLVYVDPHTTAIAKLYATLVAARWPDAAAASSSTALGERWLDLARAASRYRWWGPELEDVAAAALRNAIAEAGCAATVVGEARAIARDLRGMPDRVPDGPRDTRLADAASPGRCHP